MKYFCELLERDTDNFIEDVEFNICMNRDSFNIDEYIEQVERKYKQKNTDFDMIITDNKKYKNTFISKIDKSHFKSLMYMIDVENVEQISLSIFIK